MSQVCQGVSRCIKVCQVCQISLSCHGALSVSRCVKVCHVCQVCQISLSCHGASGMSRCVRCVRFETYVIVHQVCHVCQMTESKPKIHEQR